MGLLVCRLKLKTFRKILSRALAISHAHLLEISKELQPRSASRRSQSPCSEFCLTYANQPLPDVLAAALSSWRTTSIASLYSTKDLPRIAMSLAVPERVGRKRKDPEPGGAGSGHGG